MSDALPITRPLSLQDLLEGFGSVSAPPSKGEQMVHRLLQKQRELSAVELFAKEHARGTINGSKLPDQARFYASLLPATPWAGAAVRLRSRSRFAVRVVRPV